MTFYIRAEPEKTKVRSEPEKTKVRAEPEKTKVRAEPEKTCLLNFWLNNSSGNFIYKNIGKRKKKN